MRSKNMALMRDIKAFAEEYYETNLRWPSLSDAAKHFGITRTTVYRYLVDMDKLGMVEYSDGHISTDRIQKIYGGVSGIPVVGSIPCVYIVNR